VQTVDIEPTPLAQTARGHLLTVFFVLHLSPPTVSLVLNKSTLNPFFSKRSYQMLGFLVAGLPGNWLLKQCVCMFSYYVYCFLMQQSRATSAGYRRITYGCSQLLNAADFLRQVLHHYLL